MPTNMQKTNPANMKKPPCRGGVWNRERLCMLLTDLCYIDTEPAALKFFSRYRQDPALCGMLLSILSDKECEGSDVQMGAARITAQMHPDVLRENREQLLVLQSDPVIWKRPFPDGFPDWLNDSFTG